MSVLAIQMKHYGACRDSGVYRDRFRYDTLYQFNLELMETDAVFRMQREEDNS